MCLPGWPSLQPTQQGACTPASLLPGCQQQGRRAELPACQPLSSGLHEELSALLAGVLRAGHSVAHGLLAAEDLVVVATLQCAIEPQSMLAAVW